MSRTHRRKRTKWTPFRCWVESGLVTRRTHSLLTSSEPESRDRTSTHSDPSVLSHPGSGRCPEDTFDVVPGRGRVLTNAEGHFCVPVTVRPRRVSVVDEGRSNLGPIPDQPDTHIGSTRSSIPVLPRQPVSTRRKLLPFHPR